MGIKMILPACRDDLFLTIIKNIRFSVNDSKFMEAIFNKYINKNQPLSENQNILYEKIIHKYRKQFKKLGISYKDIIETPWKNKIIPVDELMKNSYFKLEISKKSTLIKLSFPFNKKMIDLVRSMVYDDNSKYLKKSPVISAFYALPSSSKYDFSWNKADNNWSGKYSPYLFNELLKFSEKFDIQIDETITQHVTNMQKFKNIDDYETNMVVENGLIVVKNASEGLLPHISKFDMSDMSVKNIDKLCLFGIKPPPTLHAPMHKFMNANRNSTPVVIDDNSLEDLVNYLDGFPGTPLIILTKFVYDPVYKGIEERLVKKYPKSAVTSYDHLDEVIDVEIAISFMQFDWILHDDFNISSTMINADRVIYVTSRET